MSSFKNMPMMLLYIFSSSTIRVHEFKYLIKNIKNIRIIKKQILTKYWRKLTNIGKILEEIKQHDIRICKIKCKVVYIKY